MDTELDIKKKATIKEIRGLLNDFPELIPNALFPLASYSLLKHLHLQLMEMDGLDKEKKTARIKKTMADAQLILKRRPRKSHQPEMELV